MQKSLVALVFVIAATLGIGASAEAQTNIFPLSNLNQTIWIGMVDHGAGTSVRPWVCYEGSGTVQWSLIGTTSGLNGNYVIHGDVLAGGTTSDTMRVIRSSTSVFGNCAPDTGNWEALTYNGYSLSIRGGGGLDVLQGGAGQGDTFGDAGNDLITCWGPGVCHGNDGEDNLVGQAGSADQLYGDGHDDCLNDISNSWSTYDCGDGNDDFHSGDTGTKSSCENPVSSC